MNADCARYSAILKEAYTGEEAQQYLEDNEVTILKDLADNEFDQKSYFIQRNVVR